MNKISLLPLNEDTVIKVGDSFNKEGTTFNIIERCKNYTIAKQTMKSHKNSEVVIAYEVAEIRTVADAIFDNGKWVQTGKKAEYYPGGNSFGVGIHEKTFPARMKEEALRHFESVKELLDKGFEMEVVSEDEI